jgi:hypothetical protein
MFRKSRFFFGSPTHNSTTGCGSSLPFLRPTAQDVGAAHLRPGPVALLCTMHMPKPGATCTGDRARTPVVHYPPATYNVPYHLNKLRW